MSDILTEVSVKRGDVGVLFTDTLTITGFDFTGAAVTFVLWSASGNGERVTGAATPSNATTGSVDVSYTTTTGQLATADDYFQEWEVTKAGKTLTCPSNGYNLVHVLEDGNS